MSEIWKVYKDTSYRGKGGLYEVSNEGNVKCNGKEYKPTLMSSGYYMVGNQDLLHRIVAELFIPNPDNKPQVDHIDGNRQNNKATNLRWVTAKENMNNPNTKPIGEKNPMFGRKQTKESRKKQSEARKQLIKDNPEKYVLDCFKYANKNKHRVYHNDGTYHYEK